MNAPKRDVVEPVRKSIEVRGDPDHAFRCFTSQIGMWWPLESHSLAGGDAATCALEGRVGGRLLERSRSGEEIPWGTVTEWLPPRRLCFTFHPGRAVEQATRVTVSFSEAAPQRSRVELLHEGWQVMGAAAAEMRETYDQGWDLVFARRYGAHADRPSRTG